MDQDIADAVASVQHTSSDDAGRWFALICDEHEKIAADGLGGDWVAFRQRVSTHLESEFDAAQVEALMSHLAGSGGIDLADRMCAQGAQALGEEYARQQAQAYDEDAWAAYLLANEGAWDGAEGSWDQFETSFVYYANEAGVRAPAEELMTYVKGQPDKVAALAPYGVTSQPVDDDLQSWQRFLSQFGVGWNGVEGDWDTFKEAFLYHAGQLGHTDRAAAFVSEAEANPLGKAKTFEAHGIFIDTERTPVPFRDVINEIQTKLPNVKDVTKVVKVPDDEAVTVGTPFGNYPSGYIYGLGTEDYGRTMESMTSAPADTKASDIIMGLGGASYDEATGICFVTEAPHPEFGQADSLKHEMGHASQKQRGYSNANTQRVILEYHNIIVNENALTGGVRIHYENANPTLASSTREKFQKDFPGVRQPTMTQLRECLSDTEAQALTEIEAALADPRYLARAGVRTVREKALGNLVTEFFNKYYEEP